MPDCLNLLTDDLVERARLARKDAPSNKDGDLVVYWMRTALRGHENPALDAARMLADGWDVPLLVVHEARSDQAYASDRLISFDLEGAADAAEELAALDIPFRLYVQRRPADAPVIGALAARARALVTEDMPTEPYRAQVRAVAAGETPVVLVDTACILPMRAVTKRYDRAFKFRKATEKERSRRLLAFWEPYQPLKVRPLPGDLPAGAVSQGTPAAEIVASMAIDHGIGPVADTRGGSRAGYTRWAAFRDRKLRAYARDRNDALLQNSVSRMSAYLHGGHVSPFTLAREAEAIGGAGAEKFLDEFFVWRELAHNWCFHTADPDSLEGALPSWAVQTLKAHANDARPARFDGGTLARGRTGDALWDAAQWSLLRHGELHNNLRMTWGKQVLAWTDGPAAALQALLDLNHRYALDGRDPNSYGGLLWCLGQFDRPFEPPEPIFGTVRPRSTAFHAKRLDVAGYRGRVMQANGRTERIAVIGAGMAGLTCARALANHGHQVQVFDKGRGLGGRLATRRVDGYAWDHGAQYFTARDETFRRYVAAWAEQGIVAAWADASEPERQPRWVGTPRMSALGRQLAEDLDVTTATRVQTVQREADGWRLTLDDGASPTGFDQVVVAVPAPQAVDLLTAAPDLQAAAADAAYHPCWALLLAIAEPIDLAAALRPDHPAIAWIARNETKPGRDAGHAAAQLVVHATPAWSAANLEREPSDVAEELLSMVREIAGWTSGEPLYLAAHRWRYALVERAYGQPVAANVDQGIYACGDWCLEGRIEAAFLSGLAAAGRVLGRIAERARA